MTQEEAKEKLLEVMSVRYDKRDHVCLKSFINDVEVFVLSKFEQLNTELQARIKELEEDYSEQEYRFSCILDAATGGRASKTNIDLYVAYKMISDNVDFWVNSAVDELEEALDDRAI